MLLVIVVGINFDKLVWWENINDVYFYKFLFFRKLD